MPVALFLVPFSYRKCHRWHKDGLMITWYKIVIYTPALTVLNRIIADYTLLHCLFVAFLKDILSNKNFENDMAMTFKMTWTKLLYDSEIVMGNGKWGAFSKLSKYSFTCHPMTYFTSSWISLHSLSFFFHFWHAFMHLSIYEDLSVSFFKQLLKEQFPNGSLIETSSNLWYSRSDVSSVSS